MPQHTVTPPPVQRGSFQVGQPMSHHGPSRGGGGGGGGGWLKWVLIGGGGLLVVVIGLVFVIAFIVGVANAKAKQEAAVKDIGTYMTDLVSEKKALAAEFERAGGLSPRTISTRASIDGRIALLAKLEAAQTALMPKIYSLKGDLEAKLDDAGVSGKSRDEFWRGFNKGSGGLANVVRIHEIDTEVFKHARVYLTVLKQKMGGWTPMEDGRVLFQDDEDLSAFNAAVGAMERLNNEQKSITPVR